MTGQKIRERRVELGWPQEKLAEKMGISTKSVSRHENGEIEMGFCTLQHYEDILMLPRGTLYMTNEESSPGTDDIRAQIIHVLKELPPEKLNAIYILLGPAGKNAWEAG